MAATLDQTKSAALALLGKGAKIPPAKTDLNKLHVDFAKARDEYYASVDVLQKKILTLQNMISTNKNVLTQYQDILANNDFGLDEDADGAKDKLAKAHKLLDSWFDERIKISDSEIKNLSELDKHSMALARYKSPA